VEIPPLLHPLLLAAITWVTEQSMQIARLGVPLPQEMLAVAKDVGVAHPERIRVMLVDRIPVPKDPVLRLAALCAGLLPPGACRRSPHAFAGIPTTRGGTGVIGQEKTPTETRRGSGDDGEVYRYVQQLFTLSG